MASGLDQSRHFRDVRVMSVSPPNLLQNAIAFDAGLAGGFCSLKAIDNLDVILLERLKSLIFGGKLFQDGETIRRLGASREPFSRKWRRAFLP